MAKKKAAKKLVKAASEKRAVPEKKAASGSGVGRPKGSGKFGCETKVIRVPSHMVEEIFVYVTKKLKTEQKEK